MTILFQEDWELYPNAIIDTQTSNQSFVRLAALYREMGIKNHAFCLALHNPLLQGVDPHSPELTTEQMLMIGEECQQNFWYFLREVARAPGRSTAAGIPIRANRGNIALYWLFFNHIMVILIQIRQTGKSLGIDLLNTYLMNIGCSNTDINIVTKDETLRSFNLERLKDLEGELPFYLRLRKSNDIGNTQEIKVTRRKNVLRVHLPSRSPNMALKVGRGLTGPIFGFDEVAFLPNIEISLPAALAAGTAARDFARQFNQPYGSILATTAGKKDDRDGRYIYNMVTESAPWTEAFFDCKDLEELERVVLKSSSGRSKNGNAEGVLQVNCTFNHRQLGYTDEWLRRAVKESKAEGDAADRDFFNRWTSGSQSSPFSTETAGMIRAGEKDVAYTEINRTHGYVTRWYVKEEEINARVRRGFFTMGLDTSDASGGDDIDLVFRDVYTGEIIASGNFNETNLITFSEWLASWFERFENFVLIPERRSTGSMIIDFLMVYLVARKIDPFKRIFNRVVQESDEFPDRFAEINKPMFARNPDVYVKYKKLFGFATAGSGYASRTELYSTTLNNCVKYTGDKIQDKRVIDQMVSLVIRNGRVDHADGEHDDAVIAWLLSGWWMFNAKNISFYGVDSRMILSINKKLKEDNSPEKRYFRQEQENIRREIDRIAERLKHERDLFICQKYEHSLIMLGRRLVLEEDEVFSVDALIKDLREKRTVQQVRTSAQYQSNSGFGYKPNFR